MHMQPTPLQKKLKGKQHRSSWQPTCEGITSFSNKLRPLFALDLDTGVEVFNCLAEPHAEN